MKTVKLGILGMGTVASGMINIIEFNNAKISEGLNKNLQVSKVLIKNPNKKRNVNLADEVYTTDAYDVINDADIEILVELIGGIHPAYEYVKAALKNKKHVVTANKALIATHGAELESLASENGVRLMYEASVAGGIPVINTISENLSANEFERITGIINGTTNYILTQMSENELEYQQAVKQAQELGFAEADPSSDVDGDDAVYKISILSDIAFGQKIKTKDVLKEGITKISKEDMIYAKKNGYCIKLLASAVKNGDEFEVRVHPAFVPLSHPLATVKNEFNAVFLKGNAVGELMLYGKGAGSLPTGSAVLEDIISIIKNGDFSKLKANGRKKLTVVNRGFASYYIRLTTADATGALGRIAPAFAAKNIGLASSALEKRDGGLASLTVVTCASEHGSIVSTIEEIQKLSIVKEVNSIIMFEDFK